MWLPLMCPPLGIWPATQACALTGNRTRDPLLRRLVLNPLNYTSQGYFFFLFFFVFLKDFIYLFLDRGEEWREREGEKHQCVVDSPTPCAGDLAYNSGTCPDWEWNWLPFGLQTGIQSTEPHQPGPFLFFFNPHLRTYSLIFREKEKKAGREREQERNISQLPPVCALTRDQIFNLLVYRTMLQPTEPPGQD